MAVLYEKVATGVLSSFYRQVAREITSSVKRGRVLDVGTGPGHLLVEIARGNPDLEVVGLDLSQRMLTIAKAHTEQCARIATTQDVSIAPRPRSQIQLVRGDVQHLPFCDDAFDMVVSTLSLHHWQNPAKGIQECLRVTAPGGQCWIYDLRTDVPARRHAELVTGEGIRGLLLSWIFKFHGIAPRDYESQSVARWVCGRAKVQAEMHAAYLKLNIQKPLRKQEERNTPSSLSMARAAARTPAHHP